MREAFGIVPIISTGLSKVASCSFWPVQGENIQLGNVASPFIRPEAVAAPFSEATYVKLTKRRGDGIQSGPRRESDGRMVERQPFSPNSVNKAPRTRGATEVTSVCPYCAVGCSQKVYVKDGKIIDIEGNYDSPINEGTLCPKGANTFQLTVNPHRIKKVLYRAPFSDHWEERPLDWAMRRVAERMKETRDADFVEKKEDGAAVNHLTTVACLGGATMDNEENYLIKKLFGGGLGVVSIENQARI
jgi:formate dehydrogenase major subunit